MYVLSDRRLVERNKNFHRQHHMELTVTVNTDYCIL
jgi:hypothetical protein